VVVLVLEDVHLMDLAGPVQVFWEAAALGGRYAISYAGMTGSVLSAQGLPLGGLEELPEIGPGDLVLVPGTWSERLDRLQVPGVWLRRAMATGARIVSICSGAFALAHAGLLDGRRCTTHWKVVDRLRALAPAAEVLENRLFVEDGNLWTSAGETAGIDLALALVERDNGPMVAARVAREMVVFLRRRGEDSQSSVYLEHRAHLHPGVHRVQDFLVAHPERRVGAGELARLAGMSPRHLARVFRDATGLTAHQFGQKVKLEVARGLVEDPRRSVEAIAESCGFADARQLRRLWRLHFGTSISERRRAGATSGARSGSGVSQATG
jgi:transcriptional regulator GlxA family with amidase domain